jgi:CRISPR/Cas system CSM-associated protein Csm2 small subunit
MINSSAVGRQDRDSETLELESILPSEQYPAIIDVDCEPSRRELPSTEPLAEQRPIPAQNGATPRSKHLLTASDDRLHSSSIVTQSITIDSTGEKFDIRAELESILKSLKLPTSNKSDRSPEDSISDTLAQIAAATPIAHSQQLLVELDRSREQLAISQAELESLHQRNQAQVDTVESSVLQVKQIKFRTQQLARHSQSQIQKVQHMLGSLEQIRQDVVTNLDKFGGYAEIHVMLVQLEDTRHTLTIAHDRLKTGQEAFYESLRAIQEQVSSQSQDTEQKLADYQQSLQGLVAAISADRDRIAVMGVEITLKLTELSGLSAEMTTLHGQIVAKSETLQGNITSIDRGFAELSQSVQKEKEQFYELTAETIDKAEVIRSQFSNIANQIGLDREAIEQLKTEVESVRYNAQLEAEHQLNHFDRQYNELMSTWGELQVRQKNLSRQTGRVALWLWILSVVVGIVLILLVTVLMNIR